MILRYGDAIDVVDSLSLDSVLDIGVLLGEEFLGLECCYAAGSCIAVAI
jgi:hypothetical protein